MNAPQTCFISVIPAKAQVLLPAQEYNDQWEVVITGSSIIVDH